jgi:uncharacterized protein with HEPN domain
MDMVESIQSILEYTNNMNLNDFKLDKKTVDAVIRNFEVLGKAAGKVHYTIKKSNLEVEWRLIKDMRNKLIHEYFGIDHKIIYATINKELPGLLEKIQRIITANYSGILPIK